MSKLLKFPYPVILASASPQRQELLKKLIQDFNCIPADIDEEKHHVSDPWVTAQKIAKEKALLIYEKYPNHLVIAGDTIVTLKIDNKYKIFGKPKDEKHAYKTLKTLSGKEHIVITGIAIIWPKGFHCFTETTFVTFKPLSDKDILSYIETDEHMNKAVAYPITDQEIKDCVASKEPFGKAGAYAIQGTAKKFVKELKGSESNVIGLPLERLAEELRDIARS